VACGLRFARLPLLVFDDDADDDGDNNDGRDNDDNRGAHVKKPPFPKGRVDKGTFLMNPPHGTLENKGFSNGENR